MKGNRFIIELLGLEKGKAYGYQEYIFNLLHYFYRNRDSIQYEKIIVWCKKSELDMFNQFKDLFEIKGFDYSSYLRRHWLQTILPIKYKLDENDLLFSPGNTSGLIKRSNELLTIHDLLYKRKNWIPSALMRWHREFFIPISIKKADKIVAISDFTKKEIEHYYPNAKGKVDVIHNAFNFSKFNGEEKVSLGFDYFLAISTNVNYKNQKAILKAFHNYCENGGEKRLVVVGKFSPNSEVFSTYELLPENIKERIIQKSNISNIELGALYRGASCYISASRFEGLGMPVVEAMSFGLPVILSDIPPHREVSMNKGEYFDPDDVPTLASLMKNLDFCKRSYAQDIRDMFSDENTSAKYIDLINSI